MRCDLVVSAGMSRNHFEKLRNNLHIVDVNYPDATDRLWNGSEPLVHHLYEEMMVLVQKLLGRFVRSEAYRLVNGKDLPRLDINSPAIWKASVEVGADTEAAMSNWEPAEKRAFRLGARNFYLKATDYLLSRLPFQNMTLRSLRCLSPNAREEESSGPELRCLAMKLPQVIQPGEISILMDEYTVFQLDTLESAQNIDEYWRAAFDLKKCDGTTKYPLSKLVNALLSIPHGNADVERGFSENRRLLQDRARLTLDSINGIRYVVPYGKRFDSDPSSFTITPEVLRVVRNSKKRYSERLALEKEQSAKRPREEPEAGPSSEGQDLQKEVETAKKMLTNAELLIAHGLKTKDFAEVESGNSLLALGKSRLEMAIQKMAEILIGIAQDFKIYQGKGTGIDPSYAHLGLGGSVVLRLCQELPKGRDFKCFFDNYFTSVNLLHELQMAGIQATGTIRGNRPTGCNLSEKELRKEGRGAMDTKTTEEGDVVLVRWLDNSVVNIASTQVGCGSVGVASRWIDASKERNEILCPDAIIEYNKFMGGVDKLDFVMALYHVKAKTRKWPIRAMCHFISLALANSWLEYMRDASDQGLPRRKALDMLAFQTDVAVSLVQVNKGAPRKRGRPSADSGEVLHVAHTILFQHHQMQ
ncbi:hypothetical protein MTO96_018580 [Rhipicephalus appendiculatus]